MCNFFSRLHYVIFTIFHRASRFSQRLLFTQNIFCALLFRSLYSRFENHHQRNVSFRLGLFTWELRRRNSPHTLVIALSCDCRWFLLIHNAFASLFCLLCLKLLSGSYSFKSTFTLGELFRYTTQVVERYTRTEIVWCSSETCLAQQSSGFPLEKQHRLEAFHPHLLITFQHDDGRIWPCAFLTPLTLKWIRASDLELENEELKLPQDAT